MNGSLMNLEEFTTLSDAHASLVQLCLNPSARHSAIRLALATVEIQTDKQDRAAHWLLRSIGIEILHPLSRSRLDAKFREEAKKCADMSNHLELLYAQLRYIVIEQFTQRSSAALNRDLRNRYQLVLDERALPLLNSLLDQ